MYKSFRVLNFRCFENLLLDPFHRVNLVTGHNNMGKSALLEALFVHCGAHNPVLAINIDRFRGIPAIKVEFAHWAEEPLPWLFHGFDTTRTIELTGDEESTGVRKLSLRMVKDLSELEQDIRSGRYLPEQDAGLVDAALPARVLALEYEYGEQKGESYLVLSSQGVKYMKPPEPPLFPAFFLAPRTRPSFKEEADRFGKLQIHGKLSNILKMLRIIEPRLKDMSMVVVGDQPILHGDISLGRLVPLPMMGEGVTRLASIGIHIGNASGGVVLIDEIENGLHHSILKDVWTSIGKAARDFNTQIVATTHSFECIVAAHQAFSANESYDFRLHRLERVGEKIRSIGYDQGTLEAAIETGLEVR